MEKIQVVYAGKRRNGYKTEMRAVWYKLVDGKPDLSTSFGFITSGKKNRLKGTYVWPGDTYWMEVDGDNCILGEKIGQIEDETIRKEWRVEERAAETGIISDKQSQVEGFGDFTLNEIKALYQKQVGSARRAGLLAAVTQHITG